MNQLSDEELYQNLLAGESTSFRALYDRHSSPLFRFVYRFTVNREHTEEILHDIFLELLNRKFQLSSDSSLKSWLYTLAKNKSLNHLKKSSFEIKNKTLVEASVSPHVFESPTTDAVALHRLNNYEAGLPEDLRSAWLLKKEGFDYRQISEKLAIPVGTVKSRFHRLVIHLKKEFENES